MKPFRFLLTAWLVSFAVIGVTQQVKDPGLVTDTEKLDRQVDVPAEVKIVEINHQGGDLTVVGWDRPHILLEATKQARAQAVDYARLLMENLDIVAYERIPNRLVLEFKKPPITWRVKDENIRIDYTAHIPRQLALDVHLRDGSLSVSNIDNLVAIDHRAGSVSVKNIGHRMQIRSMNSNVIVDTVARDLKMDTKDSVLKIQNIKGQLAVRHQNGDIQIQNVSDTLIMNTLKGDVTLSQIAGRLDIDHREGNIVANNYSGGMRIYLRGGTLRLAPQVPLSSNYYCVVDDGDVILRVPPQSSMLAEIEVERGGIYSDFQMPIRADKSISFAKGAINGGQNIVQLSVKNGNASLLKGLGALQPETSAQSQSTQNTAGSSAKSESNAAAGGSADSLDSVELPE